MKLLRVWQGLGLAAVCVLSACAGGPKISETTPYGGPPMEVDSSRRVHQLVMQAPSAGWTLTLDRTIEHEGVQRVFATIRRPDPRFVYAMQVVTQHIATSIPSDQPLEVFVRTMDFGSDENIEYSRLHGPPAE